ncbi:MSHA biogenesis protein MshI [Maricurvus nonylphenolicus]|uniref:MSHA biogenesis protein MshI n=1 Tax=Maricurvus nonylphenolicus TaxID=1008307 RepID=UPI0036F41B64
MSDNLPAALARWSPWHKSSKGLVGVEIGSEGLAFAHTNVEGGATKLSLCEFLLNQDGHVPEEQFRHRIEELGLTGCACNVVLPPHEYNLLLVEAPNVPAEEMREAVRWRIKDLVTTPLDQTLIDIFHLPKDSSRSGTPMLYVVTTPSETVMETIRLIEDANLTLQYIDVTELALRNLAESVADDQRGLALVKLQQGRGSLSLLRHGSLYLSRQFELPYNGGLLDDLPEDQLVLELQRSLDYYERQMGQAPPSAIYLCGENITADKITDSIRNSLTANVDVLDMSSSLSFNGDVDDALLQLCATAIGGALRRPEVA